MKMYLLQQTKEQSFLVLLDRNQPVTKNRQGGPDQAIPDREPPTKLTHRHTETRRTELRRSIAGIDPS
ncbi:hypothetical protein EI42_03355 [Thermosporothrix hazakensis]|uniref:Uncharacterized protein n=2 Tax=Thermosporothrix TaxID=768650 RepID=A0A326U6M4_THEHA|nr:hypothetical protein EI42_03355 [Thermosporothrix hazakensis]BBH86907.1 hypothetical protein KTC_16580 [Thermosporothrix sp. COM3]GCE51200.1 hypothetical protein KTH_60690 [Thermosporothrix hazakensis]